MPQREKSGPERALDAAFRCSFCGRSSEQVDRLVGGPGVFICDACVGRCVAILDEHSEAGVAELVVPWSTMTVDEMLAALPAVAASAERVQAQVDLWVGELRRRRVTWARIGAALGVTRQSAWERLAKR